MSNGILSRLKDPWASNSKSCFSNGNNVIISGSPFGVAERCYSEIQWLKPGISYLISPYCPYLQAYKPGADRCADKNKTKTKQPEKDTLLPNYF